MIGCAVEQQGGLMNDELQREQRASKPDGTLFTLIPMGTVTGAMDAILTGEESVWVSLNDGIRPEDVVGLEVFVKLRKGVGNPSSGDVE